jgi:hypothetical protein
MKSSEAINEIGAALAIAQGNFKIAEKNGKNPHFKNEFSTITDLHNAVKEALAANSLAIIQPAEFVDNRITIVTKLIHKSGQYFESELPLKPTSDTPQQLGSAITYGRRYALAAMLNIASSEEDDDGNSASGIGQKPPAPPDNHKLFSLTKLQNQIISAKSMQELSAIWQQNFNRIPGEAMAQLTKDKDLKKAEFDGKINENQSNN